jgi:hypothetical protein
MALALRDYPGVNAQWHGNVVKKFKYADVSVPPQSTIVGVGKT